MNRTISCNILLSIGAFITLLFSCSSSGGGDNIIKSIRPTSYTTYKQGEVIPFSFKAESKYDSATLIVAGGKPITITKGQSWRYNSSQSDAVGSVAYKIVVYKGKNSYERSGSFKMLPAVQAQYTAFNKIKEYPHSIKSYTQGLEFYDGLLYESSGEYGSSFLHIMRFPSMEVVKRIELDSIYFGEGITIINDKLYQLTWKEKTLFIYDAKTLEKLEQKSYDTEGWGLTNDGTNIYMTDGSSFIYVIEPETFKVKSKFEVMTSEGSLVDVNELEWIDGKIWANVYGYASVVVIDPSTGIVERIIDASSLLAPELRHDDIDVFNGIAREPSSGKIYVTGKNWPRLFEVEENDK